jgi:hypothetical protein
VRRRYCDILNRFEPLLSGNDSLLRRETIDKKRDFVMSEWKDGLINWPSLKTGLLQAVGLKGWQDPHSAPAVAALLEKNPAAPND